MAVTFLNNTPQGGHLFGTMQTLSSAMDAGNLRFRIAAENLSNAESTATAPGGLPYQRKIAYFNNIVDKATGADVVGLKSISHDPSAFREEFQPSHPAANDEGMVLYPNVNRMVEVVDAQDANLSLRTAAQLYRMNTEMLRRTNALIDTTKS